ncbi:hypothetical protein CDAR_567861 [Caerostris darwini]|uniref:Uncharacterized protein n=1 Tax=Caerostris darwini TaxID=1538125 RepID=A0AAV4SIW2_9ARAC|nr:hypothetical protein CDAR_567861 [Caerostris darwini]
MGERIERQGVKIKKKVRNPKKSCRREPLEDRRCQSSSVSHTRNPLGNIYVMGAILTAIEGAPFVGVQCSLATSVCIMEAFSSRRSPFGFLRLFFVPKERFLWMSSGTSLSNYLFLCHSPLLSLNRNRLCKRRPV